MSAGVPVTPESLSAGAPLTVGTAAPLTVGTAGHIDHGKTALVKALTGVDTDRLPEEKERGITIALGFAPLTLPSGRVLSLIDVPGHERLLRVMVAGATGIDLFLLVVAADDGVMPQTREHLRVLEALGVRRGVVVVTKSDLIDPALALEEVGELVTGVEEVELVSCSARTGAGVAEVRAALERVAERTPSRAADRSATRDPDHPGAADPGPADPGPAVLHVDRVFTIRGAGTVVTGTLWSGVIRRGEHLALLPSEATARVRGVQVHDRAVEEAAAGQRVAVNLVGLERRAVSRGDVLVGPGAHVALTYRLEARLALHERLEDRERVQIHHGTRATPARAIHLEGDRWQLRTERPLFAADGDHLVVRRIAPPDTLGGGVIVKAAAGGRAAHEPVPASEPTTAGDPDGSGGPDVSAAPASEGAPLAPPPLDEAALALEERLRAAGYEPLSEAELGADVASLPALRAAGRAVRVGRSMHAHPEAIAAVQVLVERIAEAEGQVTLGRLRDELGTSRKYAQALLEHLDAARITRRRPDDSRVLRSRRS